MKAFSLFILSLIPSAITAQGCGASSNEGCAAVEPCYDAANPVSFSCFQSCNGNGDCDDAESCRTVGTCGTNTAITTCQYGCFGCDSDSTGTNFFCLCVDECPIAGATYPRCSTTKRQICIGSEYTHPNFASQPCLSAYSKLDVLDKGPTHLKDVEQGDKVLVSRSAGNEYQDVYGFGHRDMYSVANFLQLKTEGDEENPLEITGEHLVMKQDLLTGDGVTVRADSIRVGDILIGSHGIGEEVIDISSVKRPGLYSPLTKDGKLVVNGVQVSPYTAVQDKHPERFMVGNVELISHHFMSHATAAPFRTLCLLGGFSHFCEERNAEGQLLFAGKGETVSLWIMEQAVWVQIIVLPLLLVGMMSFHFMEQLFGGSTMVYLAPVSFVVVSAFICTHAIMRQQRSVEKS